MNNSKKKTNFWAIVGKFLAGLLTATTAIIGIYTYFSQKEEKLVASGVYSKFILPKEIEKKLFEINSPSLKDIGDILESSETETSSKDSLERFNTTNKILKYFEEYEEPKKGNLENIRFLSNFIEVKIKNKGFRQAENVSLDLDSSGFYEIEGVNSDNLQEFTKSISLGTVRPSTEIKINIWVKSYFSPSSSKVTYNNGFTPIAFNQDIPTYEFSILDYIPHIFFTLLIIIILFIAGFSIGYKNGEDNAKLPIEEVDNNQIINDSDIKKDSDKTESENK